MAKKQNHFTPMREHLHMVSSLCRYNIPGTVVAEIEVPKFSAMKREASRSSYYIKAISRTLESHPMMNSGFVRQPWLTGSRIVHFDTVDAAVSVDRKVGDTRYPFIYVIKDSNKLSVKEIDERMKFATGAPLEQIPEFSRFLKFLTLPRPVRKLMLLAMITNEDKLKQTIGTFSFTNLSPFGFESAALTVPRLLVGIGKHDGDKIKIGYSFNHVLTDGMQLGLFHRDIEKRIKNCEFD